MADHSLNSSRLRRNMSKLAYRSKEKVMRSIGRAEETKDEILDHYVMLINKQQLQMQKLHRDMKQYLVALKAMSESQKNFYNSLYEIYDDDWAGKDVIASCSQRSGLLHDDIFARFQAEVVDLLQNHATEYQKCKLRIEKRGRKLVDYDAARRTLQSLEAAKKPDTAKIQRAKEHATEARETYEELNNGLHQDLPSLYDSRLPICVDVFSSICKSETVFSNEVSELRTKLSDVLENLKSAFDNGEYHIQRMQPPLDNGRVAPTKPPASPSESSGSPSKVATSSTVPSSTPPPSQKEAAVPPRSPDHDNSASSSSDPSTHEYVNLQIGSMPDVIKPVSEEEEHEPGLRTPEQSSDIKRKKRPASMYAPSAAVGLSVYEGDKEKAKDDGSGSADPKKAATLSGHTDAKKQPQKEDGKQHKSGLFGFLGLKRSKSKTAASSPLTTAPAAVPEPAEEQKKPDDGKAVAAVAVASTAAVVATAATSSESHDDGASQAKDEIQKTLDSEKASAPVPTESTDASKESDQPPEKSTLEVSRDSDAAEDSDEDMDAAFAKFQKKTDIPDEQQSGVEISPGGQGDISPTDVQEQTSCPEPVEVEAEIRRLSMENDPVFSVAVDSSSPQVERDEEKRSPNEVDSSGMSFDNTDVFGNVGNVPADVDAAFGNPDKTVTTSGSGFEDGFADAFVPASPQQTTTEDEVFGSEPFNQAVLEDPDVVLKRDNSIFDEGAPTSPVNFSSANALTDTEGKAQVVSEGERLYENVVIGQQQVVSTNEGNDESVPNEGHTANADQSWPNAVDVNEHAEAFPQSSQAMTPTDFASKIETALNASEQRNIEPAVESVMTEGGTPVSPPVVPPNTPAPGSVLDSVSHEVSLTNSPEDTPDPETEETYLDMEIKASVEEEIVYEEMQSPGVHDPGFFQDTDESNSATAQTMQNVTSTQSESTQQTEEFPTPDSNASKMNGDGATVIQPIYEEPPREDPQPTPPAQKSPSKSLDSHRYLDLPPNYLFSVQALYQYRSSDDDELSFDKGEIIHIVEHPEPDEQDDGWQMGVTQKDWEERGEVEPSMGVFPENFTKRIQL